MIFKTIEKIDKAGNVTQVVARGKQAKAIEAESYRNNAMLSLQKDRKALVEVAKINRDLINDDIDATTASLRRTEVTQDCSDAIRDLGKSEKTNIEDVKKWNKEQKKQIDLNEKATKSFKGFSASTVAMFKNIGAELAIAFAFQVAMKAFQAADEKWGLTAATRIEKMETAINDYNDALSESSDNIKTIESLESEFESLSKGVDSSGRNIGLTNEQFARYNEIANQLADLSPVLIQGYTAEGNAIIDRNKAIEDGIKAQKDYAAAATSAFTTNVTGNDIIDGVQDKIKEAQKNLKKSVNAGTSILSARGSNVGSYSSDLTTLYGGKSFDLDKTSLTEMKKLAEMRGKYLSDLIDSDKYTKEEISNIKAAGDAFHQGLLEIESQYQPVYEWLSTAMNTAAEEGALSITESIPESLRDAYEAGLKYISTQDLSAVEMRATGSDLATKLQAFYSGATSYGEKYLGIQEKITAAQEELETNIDGVNDSVDIENYETKVEGYLDAIEKLAEELRAEGGVVNEALADIIESEYLDAINFAQNNILDLADSFNPLIDKIKEAQGVKESFDAAIAGGDYDTALDGIKEVYDTILDGENNAGHGSQTAWIGAEQILGEDTLSELDYNWDTIESRLKSMKTLLSGGESGTSAFFNLLRDSREELNKISDGAVKVDQTTGAISFDFDEDKWAEYADALNMSEETLTALVNASRQFADIDLGDPVTIKNAISESDTGFHNIDTDQVYDFYDTVKSKALQAGYSAGEFNDRVAELESAGIHLIRLDGDAKELASTFAGMSSALATVNKDGTFTVNAEQVATQMFEMGRSTEEVLQTIQKFNKEDGVELKFKKPKDTSWEDYIKNLQQEYNKTLETESDNPFDSLATSADKFTAAVNQLVVAMGMIPDIDIDSNLDKLEKDVNEFARSYNTFDESGKASAENKINDRIKEEEETISLLQTALKNSKNNYTREEKEAVQAEIDAANKRIKLLKDTVKSATSASEEISKATNWSAQGFISEDALKKIKDGTLESAFGNVNMDERVIIEWSEALKKKYADELSSWDYNPEVGGIDTVFGGSDAFILDGQEVEVAYTPILNIDGQAELLGQQTLSNYIQTILDKASADGQWTLEEILSLDSTGLEVNKYNSQGEIVGKQFVQGVIAGIGDEGNYSAEEIGHLLHFAGDYGAVTLEKEVKFTNNDEPYKTDGKEILEVTIRNKYEDESFQKTLNVLTKGEQNFLINTVNKGEGDINNLLHIINKLEDGEVKAQIIADVANAGALDPLLKSLDDADKEVVIKAITEGTDDVEGLGEILKGLDPQVAVKVAALINDADNNLEYINGKIVDINTGKGVQIYAQAHTETAASKLINLISLKGQADGNLSIKAVVSGFKSALNKLNILKRAKEAANAQSDVKFAGTSTRRKQSHFPSMANGGIRGQLGPKGRGGLTLTGELGTELVWSPSEGVSYLVGQYGPEMVNLPADAVVYPADETRRIIGDTIPRNRFNFGSLASGHMTFGSAGNVGGSYVPSSSSSSSSSSSKKKSKKKKITIDNYDKELAALDHQLEMGYISEVTYYKKLQALYKKYKKALKKNTEENREALEAQKQARIDAYESEVDALDYKLEMGKIGEAQYYTELNKLGKKYYMQNGKVRKGYLDEYRQWQQDKVDAAVDAYDKEAEALEKQLENGLISLEQYYISINALQKKYLTGKSKTEEREDANDDERDTIIDRIDSDYDKMEQLIEDRKSGLFDTLTDAEKQVAYGDMWQWVEGDEYDNLLVMLDEYYEKGMLSEKDYYDLRVKYLRDYSDARKDAFEEEQDSLNTIIDLVEEMIRQETEDQIDALQKQKDAYSDIIDAKKESLRITEQELEYQEEMDEYATDISELNAQIELLKLDDSRAAQAKRAELEKERDKLIKDQAKAQREETTSRTEDSLDKQDELFAEIIDKAIEKLEAFLNNKSAVLNVVMDTIEQKETNNLLNRLLAYNGEHGDAMKSTVEKAMNDLNLLIGKYGSDIESIVEVLQKGIDVNVTGGIISVDQTDYAQTQAEIDNRPIGTHHSGLATGFTGDGADIKQHEVYRLLTDDELVFNREDQMRIASQLQVLDTIKNSFDSLNRGVTTQPTQNSQAVELVVNAPITIQGNASAETVDEIKKVISDTANASLDKLNEALRINGLHSRVGSNLRKN